MKPTKEQIRAKAEELATDKWVDENDIECSATDPVVLGQCLKMADYILPHPSADGDSAGLLNEAKELIEYFVKRVEQGTIRSRTTYAMYVNFLAKLDKQAPSPEKQSEEVAGEKKIKNNGKFTT